MSEDGTTTDEQNNTTSDIVMRKKKTRYAVFASCCCCADGSGSGRSEDEGGKEHEVVIPKPRGCTDCAYLIIYVMFCCIMVLIGVFALVYGNPLRLINGMDSFGNVCGTSNEKIYDASYTGLDMTDKPYVFFFDLHDMDQSTKVCVSSCPNEEIQSMGELAEFYRNTSINLCRYDFNVSAWEDPETRRSEFTFELTDILCPSFPVYSSLPVLKRCIPTPTSSMRIQKLDFINIYGYLNSLNIFKQVLGDLAVTWVSVVVLTSFSFVISFVLVVLLHRMTALISYFIMVVTAPLCIGFTTFMWWTYADLKTALDNMDPSTILEEMRRNESAFLCYSIISTIFTILFVPVLLYLRNRIGVIVKLFREAGSALLAMPCLVIQPFITYVSLTCFFCAWLYIVLCLATADELQTRRVDRSSLNISGSHSGLFKEDGTTDTVSSAALIDGGAMLTPQRFIDVQPQNRTVTLSDLSTLTLLEYSKGLWVKYLWWIYIFGLVWCSEFILACQQMVVASAVAAWYFTRNRSVLRCVIVESICRLIKYHLGSVALGSLLITLVKFPRLVLKFTDRIFRKYSSRNKLVKWLSRSCQCCLRCFENCLRYVHHNAYTVIAIQGVGFCPASRLAFSALVQNALQISVINSIGDCVLFLAKCISATTTGLIAMIYFQQNETLYFYAVPVLMTIIFSYFVAHCVISVFEMAVDTLFLCFVEDHNMHADSPDGQQFYAPPSLLRFMTVDAVDALAPGRGSSLPVEQANAIIKSVNNKSEVPERYWDDRERYTEEAIPMNPYASTTERVDG